MLAWTWWEQILFGAALLGLVVVLMDMRRTTLKYRRAREARRLQQRLDRRAEDMAWQEFLDEQMAELLGVDERVASEPVPERLLRAVTD